MMKGAYLVKKRELAIKTSLFFIKPGKYLIHFVCIIQILLPVSSAIELQCNMPIEALADP